MSQPKVDKKIFWPSILMLFTITIPLIMFPYKGREFLSKILSYTTDKFGWYYLVIVFCSMIFLTWIAFSKYGKIKLGDSEPEFSTMSWIAMLFCAGIGFKYFVLVFD